MEDEDKSLKGVKILEIGPIQLGEKPITLNFIVQHPQANQMSSQTENGKYQELFEDLQKSGMDRGRIMAVFQSSLESFAEAQRCYDSGNLDNQVAIACRTTVDNAIYEALTRKKTKLAYTFEIKANEISATRWDQKFKKEVADSGLLNLDQLNKIQYDIRDQGTFATHLAEKRDEELNPKKEYKWTPSMKNESRVKRSTTHSDAAEVLSLTKEALVLIIRNYFLQLSD